MIKRTSYRGEPQIDNGTEALTEYRSEGRWTLRLGDVVTMHTVKVKGPSGRRRKLVGAIVGMHRTRTGRVVVEVIDPGTKHLRSAHAENVSKRRAR